MYCTRLLVALRYTCLAMEANQRSKYCLYARKSSESDERQAMSIDSQLKEMRELAESKGLDVSNEKQESYSAKDSGQRPIYNEMLRDIENGECDAILTWAPDRLSRNAGDLGSLVNLMDQGKLLYICTPSQTFTGNPNDKFLLMILCSQAKLENDNKSVNVKRGIKAKCEAGWRPGVAPLGYINRAFGGVKDVIPDPERAEIITEMFYKAGYHGWSGRRIKQWLDEQRFTNRSGKPITLSQVLEMLKNPFYYGEFEYPENSGSWYQGSHEPLISKELFDTVQKTRNIKRGNWGTKQFAFKGLLECGTCGADVIGEEKFKRLKSGDVNRYVYYHCTKKIDPNCPEKYINEKKLCKLLFDFIESNANELSITNELRAKVEQHAVATKSLLEHYGVDINLSNPLNEYARYVLTQGNEKEIAELTKGMSRKLMFKNGRLSLSV